MALASLASQNMMEARMQATMRALLVAAMTWSVMFMLPEGVFAQEAIADESDSRGDDEQADNEQPTTEEQAPAEAPSTTGAPIEEQATVEEPSATDAPIEEPGGAAVRERFDAIPSRTDDVEANAEDSDFTSLRARERVLRERPAHIEQQVAQEQGSLSESQVMQEHRSLRNRGLVLMFVSYGVSVTMSLMSMAMEPMFAMSGMIPFVGQLLSPNIVWWDGLMALPNTFAVLASAGQIAGLIMTCVGARRMRRERERHSGIRNLAILPTGPAGSSGLSVAGSF